MAREKPRWQPEIDEGPHGTHPKNRDQLVTENRQRAEASGHDRRHESGAGDARSATGTRDADRPATPGGSDAAPAGRPEPAPGPASAAGPGGVQPVPSYLVPGEAEGDVRAGPGDAGAADTPERSTVPAGRSRASGASTMLWVGLAVAVVLVILLAWVF
ncbi:hypothetical protein [Roseicyclus sp.]|uniref:hypothetical protein n=1 Tax=Roseicyclus sp. TaxID=1914329 RepID=UPI003FA0841B